MADYENDNEDPVALRRRVSRGAQAAGLLQDDMLQTMLKDIESQAVAIWQMSAGPSFADERERQHAICYGVNAVRRHLEAVRIDGEIARNRLAEMDQQE